LLRAENITLDTYSEVNLSLGLGQSGRGFAYLHDGDEEIIDDFQSKFELPLTIL